VSELLRLALRDDHPPPRAPQNTNYYIPGQYVGEGSDWVVEDYDAVQSGMLLVLLTFGVSEGQTVSFFRTKVN